MPFIYSIRRPNQVKRYVAPLVKPDLAVEGSSYRDLQAQAKTFGIPGKQKAGKLKKAIAEAKRNG